MHSGVIVLFETTDKRFLRLVTELVESLKSTPQKSNIFLQDLQDLCMEYIKILPEHFFELLHLIKDLINNYAYYVHLPTQLYKGIDRILLLCTLLQEEPTVDLFEKFVENHFETIYEYADFSEDVVLSIIASLKDLPSDSKETKYKENRLYWLAISNMDLSKNVLLSAIEHFYLKGNDFINFCKDIAVSKDADEEVLLALINRIEKQKISKNTQKNNSLKSNLYMTILLTALPTYAVVKRIIKIIFLEDKEYYNFFCMIIDKFGDSKEILKTVLERLNSDESQRPESIKVSIRRLRLLAMNV